MPILGLSLRNGYSMPTEGARLIAITCSVVLFSIAYVLDLPMGWFVAFAYGIVLIETI